jgi:hypothetical protein
MLAYRTLECPQLPIIQAKVLQHLTEKTDLFTVSKRTDDINWNFFSAKEISSAVPELTEWFWLYKLRLRDIAATIGWTSNGLVAHRDEPPVVAKINIPILNTAKTWNYWQDDTGTEIARFEMLAPVAFNAHMIHGVDMAPDCTYPRIVLSCMFFKDPLWLLDPGYELS